MDEPVRVGFLGCGVVGGAAARILLERAPELSRRAGATLELSRVSVRDLSCRREVTLPRERWTSDPWEVVRDPSVRVVVEAIGGIDPARELILAAVRAGKSVVTANKELVSVHGKELMTAAERAGVDLLFEAAVGGGIPIIRPLRESLAGDRVTRLMGVVNGTTNFVLTLMSEAGTSFPEALAEARRLGYTEADASADVEGHDAAAKLAILASIAFDTRVLPEDVPREGIEAVTQADIQAAHELGYEVKLLAVAELSEGRVSATVHPAMLPRTHPLAAVRGVFNAIFVDAEEAGQLMFLGRGAGGPPTASAVVGDIVEAARNIVNGGPAPALGYHATAEMVAPAELRTRYYIVLSVEDQPGVLARVAGAFADNDVSIASVRQEGTGDRATLVLITHAASDGAHQRTFDRLLSLDGVRKVGSRMRVEGTPET